MVREDLIIEYEYAECYEVKNLAKNNTNCLRVYCCQFPNTFRFQIRTYKPITEYGGKGKPRNMIAHLNLNIEQVEKILAYMKAEKERE